MATTKKRKTVKKKALKRKTKEDPDWKKLEKIIAEILKVLTPGAEVTHNDQIVGKSGTIRKIDVSIKQRVGPDLILIIIDCKRHTRAVGRGDVTKFAEQVEDVGPCVGIMITDFRYTNGAEYVANRYNIILKTYTEASEADWQALSNAKFKFYCYRSDWQVLQSIVHFENGSGRNAPPGTLLLTQEGGNWPQNQELPFPIGDLFYSLYQKSKRPRPMGTVGIQVHQPDPPYFIRYKGQLVAPIGLYIAGVINHKMYPVSLQMLTGHTLKRNKTDDVEANKFVTNEVSATDVMNTQEGIDVSPEEWLKSELSSLADFVTDGRSLVQFEIITRPTRINK